MSEWQEQKVVFSWADYMSAQYPELALMYAVPNGQFRRGQRPEPGLKPGVPDIHLPVARRGYSSMYIELKWGKNKPSAAQETWIDALRNLGNHVVVAYGADDEIRAISEYLGMEY